MPDAPVSFGRRIADLAHAHGDRIAITLARQDGSEDRLTWAGLDRWANRVARLLRARGVGPQELAAATRDQLAKYARLFRQANIKAD